MSSTATAAASALPSKAVSSFRMKETVRLCAREQARREKGDSFALEAVRRKLPVFQERTNLLTLIYNNRVVVVSGATGCGKSTQVPQYILEEDAFREAGGLVNIVVCQPRRISALGLAERVSVERGEILGSTVGYSVRLDSKRSDRTHLLFCTTGILLRRLQSDPHLLDEAEGGKLPPVSHVVIDEVHERSLETDLLLLLLKNCMRHNPRVKLILMSATLNAELFSSYFAKDGFGNCPVIAVPGFTHPVKNFFLEDVLEGLDFQIGQKSKYAKGKSQLSGAGSVQSNLSSGSHPSSKQVELVQQMKKAAPTKEKEKEKENEHRDKNKDKDEGAKKSSEKILSSSRKDEDVPDEWDVGDGDYDAIIDNGDDDDDDDDDDEDDDDDDEDLDDESYSILQRAAEEKAELRSQQKELERLQKLKLQAEEAKADELRMARYSQNTRRSLANVNESLINFELIAKLIYSLMTQSFPFEDQRDFASVEGNHPDEAGAILVFLPGMGEIRRMTTVLRREFHQVEDELGGVIIPLHGSLTAKEQRRVFERASFEPGSKSKGQQQGQRKRKIVLATNVAETSITIEECTVVIDAGKHREMQFDAARGLAVLAECWISKAAAKQRAGRAGRTRPGLCFRTYSLSQHRSLDEHPLPEMMRIPLERLCLQLKSILSEDVAVGEALADALDPPPAASVAQALRELRSLNAIEPPEKLTPLGQHLARMPMEARVGKMLLFATLFRCIDPVLTIAAAMSGKSPFYSPPDQRNEAEVAKRKFATSTGKSDHMAVVAAFNGWMRARTEGAKAEKAFTDANFLSQQRLYNIEAGREDLASILVDLGFAPREFIKHMKHAARQGEPSSGWLNSESGNHRVVKAVICAGFYPNLISVKHPSTQYVSTAAGTFDKDAKPKDLKFFTRSDGRVFLHPSSVVFQVGKFETPWLIYSERLQTNKIFVHDVTMVPQYALLLFGGQLHVDMNRHVVSVDDWARFDVPPKIAILVKRLRDLMNSLLETRFRSPSHGSAAAADDEDVISALCNLLIRDGL